MPIDGCWNHKNLIDDLSAKNDHLSRTLQIAVATGMGVSAAEHRLEITTYPETAFAIDQFSE